MSNQKGVRQACVADACRRSRHGVHPPHTCHSPRDTCPVSSVPSSSAHASPLSRPSPGRASSSTPWMDGWMDGWIDGCVTPPLLRRRRGGGVWESDRDASAVLCAELPRTFGIGRSSRASRRSPGPSGLRVGWSLFSSRAVCAEGPGPDLKFSAGTDSAGPEGERHNRSGRAGGRGGSGLEGASGPQGVGVGGERVRRRGGRCRGVQSRVGVQGECERGRGVGRCLGLGGG